jgi:4-hydroxy-2-oxoheptanedioate aldolase
MFYSEANSKPAAETNNVRKKWANSQVAIGTWAVVPAISTTQTLGQSGFDFVVFEQQHGFIAQENLLPLIQAAQLTGCTPIVRVGEDDIMGIGRALDLGARGIIVPMVSTPEQAQAIADAMKFPPLGKRSYGGLRNHASTREANDDVFCIVMIETPEGVKNADKILSVPGIDGAFIGPSDLTLTMGIEPEPNVTDADLHLTPPEVVAASKAVAEACLRNGKRFGVNSIREDEVRDGLDAGASIIFYGGDIVYVAAGSRKDVAMLRGLTQNIKR